VHLHVQHTLAYPVLIHPSYPLGPCTARAEGFAQDFSIFLSPSTGSFECGPHLSSGWSHIDSEAQADFNLGVKFA
jgi:hypothetical protein